MFLGFKKKFFNSIVYKLYKRAKEHPLIRYFIDYNFFKKCIFSVNFINYLLNKFSRFYIPVKMKDIYIFVYIYVCAFMNNPLILFWYSFFLFIIFLSDKKYKKDSFLYFIISVLYLLVILIINPDLYNIWSSVTIFVLLSIYLKKIPDMKIKKNLFSIFLISLIFSYNYYHTLILILPFMIYYFPHIKRKYLNVAVGGVIILFVINFLRYIFIKIQKYSLDVVIKDVLFYINKGIKGEISLYLENVNKIIKNNIFLNMSYSEKILFFGLVVFILFFIILLGKAVFKLARKAIVQIFLKDTDKSFFLSSVLFFIISSLYLIFAKGDSVKSNYMYWAMLGFIKSKIK